MRRSNWGQSLNSYLETEPKFKWGVSDCCMFAAECIKVMTGVDHATDYRGYVNMKGELKMLQKYGGVEGIATCELGESKDVKLASRGDVVSLKGRNFNTLGVCTGDKIVSVGRDGLVFFSMSHGLKAWSV